LPISIDLSEEAFGRVTGKNSKADLIRILGNDLDEDADCGGDSLAGIFAISEDALDEWKESAGLSS
jgi:hypothetical protein